MTARTPSQLIARFENGDVPTQSDYVDVFDSFLNVAQTTAQTVNGPVSFSNNVSAAALYANNAQITSASFTNLNVTGSLTGAIVFTSGAFTNLTVTGQTTLNQVTVSAISAGNALHNVNGFVVNSTTKYFGARASINGAGSSIGTATPITTMYSRVEPSSAGGAGGVQLPSMITTGNPLAFSCFIWNNANSLALTVYAPTGYAYQGGGTSVTVSGLTYAHFIVDGTASGFCHRVV